MKKQHLRNQEDVQLKEVYEEEPVIPRIAESVREVPRAAEPVEGSRNFP
jgi:hypothetical protein